jgi:hypothetical protein
VPQMNINRRWAIVLKWLDHDWTEICTASAGRISIIKAQQDGQYCI